MELEAVVIDETALLLVLVISELVEDSVVVVAELEVNDAVEELVEEELAVLSLTASELLELMM